MPLFEFQCHECGNQFELLVRNGDRATCPSCLGGKLEKLMSATFARPNGSGALPISSACVPADAPPCGPGCCRLPAR